MDLFIYSDESGVFDKVHNEIFVYGGLIFIGKPQRDEYARRYIAYAYKIGLKRALYQLMSTGQIDKNIDNIFVYNDEHSTATNGQYELREGLEQEFKLGTYNMQYDKYFPPLFDSMGGIHLEFCDSQKVTLVRAADIVANRIFYMSLNRKLESLSGIYISTLP